MNAVYSMLSSKVNLSKVNCTWHRQGSKRSTVFEGEPLRHLFKNGVDWNAELQ